jgi:mannose-1-phosphate guanylyltransferase/mannose-6-phosphate isomerase
LREAGVEGAQILLEPKGRNSAPAIAAAALLAAETNPDAILWIMAADAAIGDPEALAAAVKRGAAAAAAGYFVTFGMHPTAPETGYGYIAQGTAMAELDGVFKLDRFIEKPNAEKAVKLLQSGRNLWNSGMFMFTASLLLAELEQYAPEVLIAVTAAMTDRTADLDFIRLGASAFESSPDISIDYAVAEKTGKAVVVPASIGWSDVGSWSALAEIADKDANGNVAIGDVFFEDSQNSYARSDGTITALLGVKDVVVVTTPRTSKKSSTG